MFDALIQHQTSLHLLFQIVKEQQPKRHLPHDQNLVADAFYSEWWRMTGSNRRPPACKAGALPAELWPQASLGHRYRAFARCSECRCLVRMPDRTVSHTLKEVIQPHLPIRLPCYDFTPVIGHTVASAPLAVKLPASGATNSHGVTGGVYKARERIHRGVLIRDY